MQWDVKFTRYNIIQMNYLNLQGNEKILLCVLSNSELGPFEVHKYHGQKILKH